MSALHHPTFLALQKAVLAKLDEADADHAIVKLVNNAMRDAMQSHTGGTGLPTRENAE